MYRRVISVGTIWDLDNVVYPEMDDLSQKKMTRWNYVQIMGHQLSSSRKEMKDEVKMPLFPRNKYGIRVKACCASCLLKEITKEGKRRCTLNHCSVDALDKCRHWLMAENLQKVGK